MEKDHKKTTIKPKSPLRTNRDLENLQKAQNNIEVCDLIFLRLIMRYLTELCLQMLTEECIF